MTEEEIKLECLRLASMAISGAAITAGSNTPEAMLVLAKKMLEFVNAKD